MMENCLIIALTRKNLEKAFASQVFFKFFLVSFKCMQTIIITNSQFICQIFQVSNVTTFTIESLEPKLIDTRFPRYLEIKCTAFAKLALKPYLSPMMICDRFDNSKT